MALLATLALLGGACSSGDSESPSSATPQTWPEPDVPPTVLSADAVDTQPCGKGDRDTCGTAQVPVDWREPGGPTTEVAFRVFPATGKRARVVALRPDPIVAFEGGPGYGSIGSASSYREIFGPLLETRDLILMDQRGTGNSDAISCKPLQRDDGEFSEISGQCAEQLGPEAMAYGSAAAADDMAAILGALDVDQVNLYGDSYGTYLAQTFAIRHPDLTRTVSLDGTYDDSFDPLARDAAAAVSRSWPIVCERAGTCTDINERITAIEQELAAEPLTGTGFDPDGKSYDLTVDDAAFAQLVYDASYVLTIYRDLPAAIAAHEAGDDVPLLRLAAEDLGTTGNGNDVSAYSQGAYMAVSCADYPTVWDRADPVAERRRTLDETVAALPDDAFAPIPNDAWLNSLYEVQLVEGCLEWPAAGAGVTPTPTRYAHPDVPVLVINGELDITTPLANAEAVAQAWPNSTMVVTANEIHVSAFADHEPCASAIIRTFIESGGDAGDTSCADALPQIHVVEAFPRAVTDAPEADAAQGDTDASTALDRQVAWAAAETVGDSLARWWNTLWTTTGHGLRGGTYRVRGPYSSHTAPLVLELDGVRFVDDVPVSGTVTWDRETNLVTADLQVEGPAPGELAIEFASDAQSDVTTIQGTLGGRDIDLTMPRLWSP
jgi:pimeloyl-ACP methyl ester carboxylesterase